MTWRLKLRLADTPQDELRIEQRDCLSMIVSIGLDDLLFDILNPESRGQLSGQFA
jgi:hypothetical protein